MENMKNPLESEHWLISYEFSSSCLLHILQNLEFRCGRKGADISNVFHFFIIYFIVFFYQDLHSYSVANHIEEVDAGRVFFFLTFYRQMRNGGGVGKG